MNKTKEVHASATSAWVVSLGSRQDLHPNHSHDRDQQKHTHSSKEDIMYLVHFVRKDGKPTEEYYYSALKDAREHLELFRGDDSDLYERIQIIEEGIEEKMIDSISFALGSWSRLRLGYLQDYRQDEYEKLKEAGVLSEHLATIEQSAQQMFETTMEKLKASGVEMSQASISMFAEEYTLEHIVFR